MRRQSSSWIKLDLSTGCWSQLVGRSSIIAYIANGLFCCWAEYGEWFILLVGWIGWFSINGFSAACWPDRLPDAAKPRLPLSSVKLCCDRSWLMVGAGGFWNGLLGTETDANGLLPTGVPVRITETKVSQQVDWTIFEISYFKSSKAV